MSFIKKQFTLFVFIATALSTSIHASSFYSTMTMPAPQLGGTRNLMLTIINITLCPNETAQKLAEKEAKIALNNPYFIYLARKNNNYGASAIIMPSTKSELLKNPSEKFQAHIQPSHQN
jgi:hypothetical protein